MGATIRIPPVQVCQCFRRPTEVDHPQTLKKGRVPDRPADL